ncbi:hypothetical protein JG688_00014016 [Phytophthora aleatoria]|uniref:DUF7587 domain-containing protein n=1 Tax=Phytophthora aleatoria TaxID=2496075 RepID=A0A8J5IGJ7_9STRA|nr:hypothetical protein JG688_00014016 [Phytophthora aleatoria]
MTLKLEEAPALLDEALAASNELQLLEIPSSITDWTPDLHWEILDDDNEAYGGVDASAITRTNVNTSDRKKRKKINPNKARDERRFQLIELKEQVAELEFTLQRLQTLRSKRPSRVEAERENMKLKQQYEKEKQLVKSLEKMLYKRKTTWNDTEPQATKQTRRTDIPAGYIERMTAMIFKELAAGIKMCYGRLESVFKTTDSVSSLKARAKPAFKTKKQFKRAVELHLNWSNRIPTPFVALFGTQEHAVNWAKSHFKLGYDDVFLLKIDASKLGPIFQVRYLVQDSDIHTLLPDSMYNDEFLVLRKITRRSIIRETYLSCVDEYSSEDEQRRI